MSGECVLQQFMRGNTLVASERTLLYQGRGQVRPQPKHAQKWQAQDHGSSLASLARGHPVVYPTSTMALKLVG